MTDTRLITVSAVMELTGLSKASVYRFMRRGDFPPALKLAPFAARWREDEVRAWVASRPRYEPAQGDDAAA